MKEKNKEPVIVLDSEPEKERHCPFDKTLKCEDCRLFQVFHGGVGEPICSVVRIAAWMPF